MSEAKEPTGSAVAKTEEAAPPAEKEQPEPKETLEDKLMAIAKTPEEKALAFHQLADSRKSGMVRAAAVEISNKSWGKDLSPRAQAAVARYALECGTDPVRHWEILGGKLYDTATLWLDFVTAHPMYDGHDEDYVHADKRLGDNEQVRRRELRAKYGIPEDAAGACVITIYRKDRPATRPAVGFNWAGSCGKKTKNGRPVDPIGDSSPTKTAMSRAFRRAARAGFSIWFAPRALEAGQSSDNGVEVGTLRVNTEDVLALEREQRKALPEPVAQTHEVQGGLSISSGGSEPGVKDDDVYDASEGPEQPELL